MSDVASRSLSEERRAEMKRALWLVPVADLGGVARHVIDVTRVGIPGWNVTVLCPEGPLVERLREQGATVIAASFGPAYGLFASRRTLTAAIREVKPAIVHSHLAYADIVSAVTRMPRQVRRFTTEHGIAGDDGVYHRSSLHARVMALVHRWRFRQFSGVIAVARATRDAMITKWRVRQPITVIPNGVDLPDGVVRREPDSVTGLRILSLSRLAPEKRIDCALRAFEYLLHAHPEATLTVAGEGPLRAELREIGSNVDFIGFADPDDAMAEADVVVQLSTWENCSYTLLDAVARGLRVVASDVGGNREIVSADSLVPDATRAQQVMRTVLDVRPGGPDPTSVGEMCGAIGQRYEMELR